MKTPAQWKQGTGISYFHFQSSEWQAGQGVDIRDGFIGKVQVYLFLAAHMEHAIPRQSQMLSPGLLQQNFSFSQHPDVKMTTQVQFEYRDQIEMQS